MFRPANPASIWRMLPDGSRQELVAWFACAVLHQEPDIWLVSNFDPA